MPASFSKPYAESLFIKSQNEQSGKTHNFLLIQTHAKALTWIYIADLHILKMPEVYTMLSTTEITIFMDKLNFITTFTYINKTNHLR